jgi:uncharacterized membrane protein
VLARERYVGIYIGTFGAIMFYILYCIIVWIDQTSKSNNHPVKWSDYREGSVNFLVGGTSGVGEDKILFLAAVSGMIVSIFLWSLLAIVQLDPGSVDTRNDDFEAILQASLVSGGAPPAQNYCRSLLVRKPVRSKYCATTGLVIARMDHYCIWLNISVGYGNHRMFVIFLLIHVVSLALLVAFIIRSLQREFGLNWQCGVIDRLLSDSYFFVTALCAFLMIVLSLMTALLVEQSRNMLANMVGSSVCWKF